MSELLIMNKAEMETLGREFLARGAEVGQLQKSLHALLSGTTWDGRRARQFRELWAGDFAPNLLRLQAALEENGAFIGKERTNAITAMDA